MPFPFKGMAVLISGLNDSLWERLFIEDLKDGNLIFFPMCEAFPLIFYC